MEARYREEHLRDRIRQRDKGTTKCVGARVDMGHRHLFDPKYCHTPVPRRHIPHVRGELQTRDARCFLYRWTACLNSSRCLRCTYFPSEHNYEVDNTDYKPGGPAR